jgi:hypothetical protein
MRHILLFSIVSAALLLVGCSKKNSTNPLAPNPTPQQPAPSFSIRLESGTQGMIFSAKPNVDVKVTEVIVSLPAQNFTDVNTNPNPETVFPKDTWFQFGEYTGVNSGQKWTFKITGKIAASNAPFTANATYDVP